MRLPNKEKAFVSDAKLLNYLLSPSLPEGGPKAAFFEMAGYSLTNCEALRSERIRIAQEEEVVEEIISAFGLN